MIVYAVYKPTPAIPSNPEMSHCTEPHRVTSVLLQQMAADRLQHLQQAMQGVVPLNYLVPWGTGTYVAAVSLRIRNTPTGTTHLASSDGVTYFISN